MKILMDNTYHKFKRELADTLKDNNSLKERNDILEKRVKEVEDKYTHDSGITIRNEVTKVIANFSKMEMILMMAGVQKLFSEAKTMEDGEVYIALVRKLQGYVNVMEEEDDSSVKA